MEATKTAISANATTKSREEIMAEREAKKLAKKSKKGKDSTLTTATTNNTMLTVAPEIAMQTQMTVQQLKNETASSAALNQQMQNLNIRESAKPAAEKKATLSKAERRAIQEAQRAAKAAAQTGKSNEKSAKNILANQKQNGTTILAYANKDNTDNPIKSSPKLKNDDSQAKVFWNDSCQVKLFNHLETRKKYNSVHINHASIHPAIISLGEKFARRTVVGSNARCIAFLNALKVVLTDFVTPPKKEFSRSLEVSITKCVEYLQSCRPLAVSVYNAFKHIKHVLTQFPADKPESELKENLCHFIDTYIENQIEKAAQAISSSMQEKIKDGDVILTFGCSSLINFICEEAHRRYVKFRVIIVDSRPFCEGQELLRRLTAQNIPCTYVLINALSFVMPEATKVLLGAHALLSNGYVMARTGTAQVALVARSFNVPVLVCCETHKFSERFQTDAIVYNELGNPDDLVISDKCCLTNWQAKHKMSPLNLIYDITPPELVTAVVTEVSILPCTSVPVILRIKPTEIGYYC